MNSLNKNNKPHPQSEGWEARIFDTVVMFFQLSFLVAKEIILGIVRGTFPWLYVGIGLVVTFFIFQYGFDRSIFQFFDMTGWYPRNATLYSMYYNFWVFSPLWGWGLYQVIQKRRLQNRMEEVSHSVGLKNGIGKVPTPVFDQRNYDGVTRTLRLAKSGLPIQDFQKSKSALESAMNVYVDDIRENRTKGTVDIVYSSDPLTNHYELPEAFRKVDYRFAIGTTRSRTIQGSLKETPHLLVAGQTGGGKSTFLRQLLTTLHISNDDLEMTLVDLKGGLEFQLFENLPRVKVIPDLEQTVRELSSIEESLHDRMRYLKSHGLVSIDQVRESPDQMKTRSLVVVDEAAEIFLGAYDLGTARLQEARRILSQIARQGRAVGIHLVLATQRPDSKSLDTQVKANLTGILCFQMPNNTSSITVLDSGRASLLPDIPGRALWKHGATLVEIQTPFLSVERAQETLTPYRVKRRNLNRKLIDDSSQNLEMDT
ncbi:MAG: hypothetical protein K2X47_17935 [Bdellovibrionales bacterium]|nr:hypothetical protein [Bdellovibrionales bacterium]